MVGISLQTPLCLGDTARVTVTLVLPPNPGILVTPDDGKPKYLDLSSIARLVLDFGDGLSSPGEQGDSYPEFRARNS